MSGGRQLSAAEAQYLKDTGKLPADYNVHVGSSAAFEQAFRGDEEQRIDSSLGGMMGGLLAQFGSDQKATTTSSTRRVERQIPHQEEYVRTVPAGGGGGGRRIVRKRIQQVPAQSQTRAPRRAPVQEEFDPELEMIKMQMQQTQGSREALMNRVRREQAGRRQ